MRQTLWTDFGGRHRFYRLRTIYKEARPRKNPYSTTILTADEVFHERARENGFSDEQVDLFSEQVDL